MTVETSNGEKIDYHIYGSFGDVNEEYFIIRKNDENKGYIVNMLKDFNFLTSEKVDGTDYIVDYISVNLDALTTWKEPLYLRNVREFSRETLGDNSLVIEINNQCCPRDDYNESDKPWIYFGVYGFADNDYLNIGANIGRFCDIDREVFINSYYHFSDDSDFICLGAVEDVCKWFKDVAGIDKDTSCKILKAIDRLVDKVEEHRG